MEERVTWKGGAGCVPQGGGALLPGTLRAVRSLTTQGDDSPFSARVSVLGERFGFIAKQR